MPLAVIADNTVQAHTSSQGRVMENLTPHENEDPAASEDTADGKREWLTPELVVETVAAVTEGNFFNETGDDGLGSGS